MKPFISSLILLCLSSHALAGKVHITLQISGITDNTWVYLDDDMNHKDSAIFKGEIARLTYVKTFDFEPVQLKLFTKGGQVHTSLFIDNGDVLIKGKVNDKPADLTYAGSKTNSEFLEYMNLVSADRAAIKKLQTSRASINDAQSKIDSITTIILKKEKNFIAKYPGSYISSGLPLINYRGKKLISQKLSYGLVCLVTVQRITPLGDNFIQRYISLKRCITGMLLRILLRMT